MFRAVQNRIGVILCDLEIPLPIEQLRDKLHEIGFTSLPIDLSILALQRIGQGTYQRGARLQEAPDCVDCSSFVKWLYGQIGIWIPRRTIQQFLFGTQVSLHEIRTGDLLFRPGLKNWYHTDQKEKIGHVGLCVDQQTIVHAANESQGIVRTSISDYVENGCSGCVRLVPNLKELEILQIPEMLDIETSDDLRWILLSRF